MSTIEYLKRLAKNSFGPGKFHAYCLLRQLDDYAPGPICKEPTMSNVILNKRNFGGAPPGSGIKADQMALFEEIQQAKEALENLNDIIISMNNLTNQSNNTQKNNEQHLNQTTRTKQFVKNDDEYISSKDWLIINGLAARKLDLFEALQPVCFKHCDGVVDIKKEPNTGKLVCFGDGKLYYQGDAVT